MEYKFTDNSAEVLEKLNKAIDRGLEAIGIKAESYSKDLCPVDTGRLRNSISHATVENSEILGTNVEYAQFVELGSRSRSQKPFIKPAVENHSDEYKDLIKSSLKNA